MFTRPASAAYNPPPAQVNNTPTVDPGIHSLADLLNVSTVGLRPPVLKCWTNYADGTFQAWTLLAMSGGGGQPPADYNATTNNVAWYKNST
jgi:hypothetical protein